MLQSSEGPTGTAVASSATGTTFLILIQLASRVFTFASNQLILRSLSPSILGIAAQLELYQVSILYFSRESIRMAIQRQPLASVPPTSSGQSSNEAAAISRDKQSTASQSIVNVSYLSIFLGIPLAMVFTVLYLWFAPAQASNTPFFNTSVAVTSIAALVELSIEPFFAVIQQRMLYEKRASVEMPAAFLRSFATCSIFLYASHVNRDVGALPFALGHLVYSIILICGYCIAFLPGTDARQFSFLLTPMQSRSSEYLLGCFSHRLTSLAASVFFQSLVKHLLTQGDSMMLAALSSLEDQGIYSLAANYGGLIARIIFQPLEESSRNLFSALLSPDDNGKRSKTRVCTAKHHLIEILRAYQLLSTLIFPLGPVMVPQILRILGGRQWTSAKVGDLLTLYCYYIPFLAFNGITEAFAASAANAQEIRKQTVWMGAFSACYALAAYMFLEVGSMGAYGLVLANIVNMAVRTLWSYNFIRSYLGQHGDGLTIGEVSIRPASYILSLLATVAGATQGLWDSNNGFLLAIAFSGTYGVAMLYVERQYILGQVSRLRQVLSSRSKGIKTE